jgi:hypothetical protein
MNEQPETCQHCRWYVGWRYAHHDGDCRRHSPIIRISTEGATNPLWPKVRGEHFCGEFERTSEAVG